MKKSNSLVRVSGPSIMKKSNSLVRVSGPSIMKKSNSLVRVSGTAGLTAFGPSWPCQKPDAYSEQ
jgi:hypothetical protein